MPTDIGSIFPNLFALLVGGGPVEEEGPAGSSSGTLRQSPHGAEPTPSTGDSTVTAKRSPAGKLAASRAGSSAESDPGRLPDQLISAIHLPPALDAGNVRQSSIPESGSLSGGDVEPTSNSAPQWLGQPPSLQITVAPEKTSPLQLEAGLAAQVPGKIARIAKQPGGQAEPAEVPPHSAGLEDRQSRRGSAGSVNLATAAMKVVSTHVPAPQKATASPTGEPPSAVSQEMTVRTDMIPAAPESLTAQHDGATSVEGSDAARPDRKEPGQFLAVPVPLPNRAEAAAEPELGPTDAPTPALVQPNAAPPARRPRSQDREIAVPADGMADRTLLPPVAPPAPNTVPIESSTSPATRTQLPAAPTRRSSGSVVSQVLSLSGQMPRRIESIQPAASTKAPSGSLAENRNPLDSPEVRELSAGAPDGGEVAFVVRTMAVSASEDSVRRESTSNDAVAEGPLRISVPEKQGDFPTPDPLSASENRPSRLAEPIQAPTRAGRERRLETAPFERTETHAAIPTGKTIPITAPDVPTKAEASLEQPKATEAKGVSPKDALEIQTKPEAAKATSVRDMKFEVVGVDRRVEVRLSERHGEMKMTVRTPDGNLATTLRENLPALSARLAESGFKNETWHPAASSTSEWQHTAESSKGGAFQDSNTPPREQHRESQEGSGQHHPKRTQEPLPQQQKGRDFAWLMSSLR